MMRGNHFSCSTTIIHFCFPSSPSFRCPRYKSETTTTRTTTHHSSKENKNYFLSPSIAEPPILFCKQGIQNIWYVPCPVPLISTFFFSFCLGRRKWVSIPFHHPSLPRSRGLRRGKDGGVISRGYRSSAAKERQPETKQTFCARKSFHFEKLFLLTILF